MAEFIINQDVTTDVPVVEVTLSRDKPLPHGRHLFRLIVTDESNQTSRPDVVEVRVADLDAPNAVLTVNPIVPWGQPFTMNGERSFDPGGSRIVKYAWTYMGPVQSLPDPRPGPGPLPSPGPEPMPQ
jgi:hypothetical protein